VGIPLMVVVPLRVSVRVTVGGVVGVDVDGTSNVV